MIGDLHNVAAIALIVDGQADACVDVWRHQNPKAVLLQIGAAILAVPEQRQALFRCALEQVVYGYHGGRSYGRTAEHVKTILTANGLVEMQAQFAATEAAEKTEAA